MTFTGYVEWDPETKLYVGIVPTVTGAHTQAGHLWTNAKKSQGSFWSLCLEEIRKIRERPSQFVGLQQIEIPL